MSIVWQKFSDALQNFSTLITEYTVSQPEVFHYNASSPYP
jgi:hypothetical protein